MRLVGTCFFILFFCIQAYSKDLLDVVLTQVSIDSVIHTSCVGEEDGSIILSLHGNPPYEVTYRGPKNGGGANITNSLFKIDSLKEGQYLITVTDASSADTTFGVRVTSPDISFTVKYDGKTLEDTINICAQEVYLTLNDLNLDSIVPQVRWIWNNNIISTDRALYFDLGGSGVLEVELFYNELCQSSQSFQIMVGPRLDARFELKRDESDPDSLLIRNTSNVDFPNAVSWDYSISFDRDSLLKLAGISSMNIPRRQDTTVSFDEIHSEFLFVIPWTSFIAVQQTIEDPIRGCTSEFRDTLFLNSTICTQVSENAEFKVTDDSFCRSDSISVQPTITISLPQRFSWEPESSQMMTYLEDDNCSNQSQTLDFNDFPVLDRLSFRMCGGISDTIFNNLECYFYLSLVDGDGVPVPDVCYFDTTIVKYNPIELSIEEDTLCSKHDQIVLRSNRIPGRFNELLLGTKNVSNSYEDSLYTELRIDYDGSYDQIIWDFTADRDIHCPESPDRDTISLKKLIVPDLSQFKDTTVCEGEEYRWNAPADAVRYDWTYNSQIFSDVSMIVERIADTPLKIQVRAEDRQVNDRKVCWDTTSFTVNPTETPEIIPVDSICGQVIQIIDTSTSINISIIDSGSVAQILGSIIVFEKAGEVIVEADKSGCISIDTISYAGNDISGFTLEKRIDCEGRDSLYFPIDDLSMGNECRYKYYGIREGSIVLLNDDITFPFLRLPDSLFNMYDRIYLYYYCGDDPCSGELITRTRSKSGTKSDCNEEIQWQMGPVPVDDRLYLSAVDAPEGKYEINVINEAGQKFLEVEQTVDQDTGANWEIDTQSWPPGAYAIFIKSSDNQIFSRVIIVI